MTEAKKFGCQQCGQPYDAYPPDDIYSLAVTGSCMVNDYLGKPCAKPMSYECPNCNFKNQLTWHVKAMHTDMEIREARAIAEQRGVKEQWWKIHP